MAQWFYEKDGKPTGPVSQMEISGLIISGKVKDETLVWTSSFGDEWRTARQAGLPTITFSSASSAEKRAESEASKMIATSFLEALEKKRASLSSFWAIALSCELAVWALINSTSLEMRLQSSSAFVAQSWMVFAIFIHFAVQFLFIQKDRQNMAGAGCQPLSYLWILLPQGYFLLRWERTKKYFGLFLFSLFLFLFNLAHLFQPQVLEQIMQYQKETSVVSAPSTPVSQNSQTVSTPPAVETKK
ncbi:DUF4339 domain-containing protein [Acetobacteraceae bacterium]|nr:DUF4339 domain-containing protein [Acetobacteraceae bacterium]